MAEGLAVFGALIAGALMFWCIAGIIVSLVRTALTHDEGLHTFKESFTSSAFQNIEDREGK